jgi:hypothetical protein
LCWPLSLTLASFPPYWALDRFWKKRLSIFFLMDRSTDCQIYGHFCIWKFPLQFQASWQQIVYIGYGHYGHFLKNDSFYLSIPMLLVFLYLIAANKSVLLLYAFAHKISLNYPSPEKKMTIYLRRQWKSSCLPYPWLAP